MTLILNDHHLFATVAVNKRAMDVSDNHCHHRRNEALRVIYQNFTLGVALVIENSHSVGFVFVYLRFYTIEYHITQ